MQDSDFRTIRDLTATGHAEAALNTLAHLLAKNPTDKDYIDECLKIQAQHFQLKQNEMRGILSPSELAQQRNLINHRLFELMAQMERGEKPGGISFQKQNPLLFYALHVAASLVICAPLPVENFPATIPHPQLSSPTFVSRNGIPAMREPEYHSGLQTGENAAQIIRNQGV